MKLRVGDIFNVKLDDNTLGYGQIVALPSKNTLIIAMFDIRSDQSIEIPLDSICNATIIFLGYSLDAKLYHKHWVIIGNNTSNLESIFLPVNRLGTPPNDIYLTNFKGDIIREATPDEFEKLRYKTVVAPIRFENALKAFFGIIEWNDDFNDLLYKHVIESNKVMLRTTRSGA